MIVLPDPNIKTDVKMSVFMTVLMMIITFVAFTLNIVWLQIFVKGLICVVSLLALAILGVYVIVGFDKTMEQVDVPVRLPKWYTFGSVIVTTTVLWYASNGAMIWVVPYMIARIILCNNYTEALYAKDVAYTKRMTESFDQFAELFKKYGKRLDDK